MPLAGHEGVVARVAERLAPKRIIAAVVASAGPEVATRVEHGPAGHANGPVPGALVEAVRERRAPPDQPVHIRRLDLGVVQDVECAERLVIGKEEENIGSLFARSGERIGRGQSTLRRGNASQSGTGQTGADHFEELSSAK